MLTYVKGDATYPVGSGSKFILHICNNKKGWGAGFVLAISKRWSAPEMMFRKAKPVLGTVQFIPVEQDITVVNMFAQDGYRSKNNPQPVSYEALRECLTQVAKAAKVESSSIHMPRIGCGLGGGSWGIIQDIIKQELLDLSIYVYDL